MTLREYWERFELYVLSLWLLFLILGIFTVDIPICIGSSCDFVGFQTVVKQNILPIICTGLLVLGFIFYRRFEYRIDAAGSIPVKIEELEDVNYQHLSFLATYIIPLASFDFDDNRSLSLIGVLLLVMGLVPPASG